MTADPPPATVDDLVARLERCNAAYRSGAPLVSDAAYDALVEQLRVRAPQHPYLQRVEPERFDTRRQVRHPRPMLSTEKAYTAEQLARWVQRVDKHAAAAGRRPVRLRVLPKLDGLAGRDDGTVLASRGNGHVGYDITSAFTKGVVPRGGRGRGLGELVAVKSYFEAHLADEFEHPRNMVVGIVSSDTVNAAARRALDDGQVHFVPYAELPRWEGTGEELLTSVDTIGNDLAARIDYPMDGLVAEVCDPALREAMGATTHHYRWQIAIKTRGATAVTTVARIMWQVGRTGNVTPVLEVAPVTLSGATIRRVTAHHAGLVRDRRVGPGSRIEIIRSGEVIPKLERVLTPADRVDLPGRCPACDAPLAWRRDFLRCRNIDGCPAQAGQRLVHWFRTLGTADWFGNKTVDKLVAAGIDRLERVYAMTAEDFRRLGFGPVQSRNLADALQVSRRTAVEDWRFLAALGIPDLGLGDSRKLLAHVALEDLPDVTAERIQCIHGFGEVSSRAIADGVQRIRPVLAHLLEMGFNLQHTPRAGDAAPLPLMGRRVVFTGKTASGTRAQMEARARESGAQVQTTVNAKTDYLVCGAAVGARKLENARRLGVTVIDEEEFLRLAGGAVGEGPESG